MGLGAKRQWKKVVKQKITLRDNVIKTRYHNNNRLKKGKKFIQNCTEELKNDWSSNYHLKLTIFRKKLKCLNIHNSERRFNSNEQRFTLYSLSIFLLFSLDRPRRWNRYGRFFLFEIGIFIEVDKKTKKEQLLTSYPPAETDWEIAIDKNQLETVDWRGDELNHLKGGQVFLPSEVFLNARSHRCQEVVEVHYYMYQGVEKCEERSVSSGRETEPRPNVHRK